MAYKVTSNHKEVLGDLRKKLDSLNDNQSVLRVAGLSAVAVVLNRNQQKGQNSDGTIRRSKSSKSIGAYSKAYAAKRRKRGRQTNVVDYTLEGDLARSYNVLSVSPAAVEVGFLSNEQAQKAEYLEAYYGESFTLSDAEEKAVVDTAVVEILKKLE